MSIRRGWTVEEDRILKLLKQERKVKKWSSIAKLMDYEFNMCGRNGKQCRQRYNNHLDHGILEDKLDEEQQRLLQTINDQIGNKWSVITRAFKGRTANFLKNQLYSKLRKSIRKLNKFMKEMKVRQVKPYKLSIVYKIVQSNDFKIFEKQRHSHDDLKFYSQLKEKLFRYAEQPLTIQKQDLTNQVDTINQSHDLIRRLNQFSKKYQVLNKKMKKPRKRYFCDDDIILNSLSNNKITNDKGQEVKLIQNLQEEDDDSKMEDSESDESSSTYDKKQPLPDFKNQHKLHINGFESRKLDHYKEPEQNQNHTVKTTPKKSLNPKDLQMSANQNCIIVQEGDIDNPNKVSLILEQSEQCQFMDVEYLDHFKSISFDESLFQ